MAAGVIDYGTMVSLRETSNVDPVIAALAGYMVGSFTSYSLNRIATFTSARPHSEAAWRFVLTNAFGFLLTGFMMYTQVNLLHVDYLLAKVVSISTTATINFFFYKYWAFSPSKG